MGVEVSMKMVVECNNRVGSRENVSYLSENHLLKPFLIFKYKYTDISKFQSLCNFNFKQH